ncbi:GroES-like protein [Xylariomycetidae sp. FL0641]|nr:GroES-like protein [Xylariomycetidae sp. FL0641]
MTTATTTTSSSGTHLAALSRGKGQRLVVSPRPTPTPGPDEVLVAVKAVALNPIDIHCRDAGFRIAAYPAVFGSDIGGVVLALGSGLPRDHPTLRPGTRVAAFAPAFATRGDPAHGAFQAVVPVPAHSVAAVPAGVSHAQAATLGMAVVTSGVGFDNIGVPRERKLLRADGAAEEAFLVWGAATSVGSLAVQKARALGFAVYATAGPAQHAFVRGLGARRVWDYRDAGAEDRIVGRARADGLGLRFGFVGQGDAARCQRVVQALRGDAVGRIASAPRVPAGLPAVDGVEVKFVQAESAEEHLGFAFAWLAEKLRSGEVVPSPPPKVIGTGLDKINEGLDMLAKGVSGTKLVVELED